MTKRSVMGIEPTRPGQEGPSRRMDKAKLNKWNFEKSRTQHDQMERGGHEAHQTRPARPQPRRMDRARMDKWKPDKSRTQHEQTELDGHEAHQSRLARPPATPRQKIGPRGCCFQVANRRFRQKANNPPPIAFSSLFGSFLGNEKIAKK